MRNKLLICSLMMGSLTLSHAQRKTMTALPNTWIEAVINEKAAVRGELKKANLPVKSTWKKTKEAAEPFTMNVKGMDKLVLITAGGADGSSYDWAIWGNAKLIKADGSFDWLDDLTYEFGSAGWDQPRKNQNPTGGKVIVGGKEMEHSMLCHADGILIYNIGKKYVKFEAEVGVDQGSQSGSAYFIAHNVVPSQYIEKIRKAYPNEFSSFASAIESPESWLTTPDASVERGVVMAQIKQLKDQTFFTKEMQEIEKKSSVDEQIRDYLTLFERIQKVNNLADQLEWLNVEAVQLAFDDMSKTKGFDKAKYASKMNELKSLAKQDFKAIYKGDETAIANAQKALELKRDILLANPLLDGDKIVATRYKLNNARSAMAPELGTQANNWSNQQSNRRTGYDGEIVELTNLRGDIQKRTIYKPENTGVISDLKLHWDGDRVMFTSIMPDNRLNVFEVKLDGSGYKPMIETVEKDLEFYDGTYLPDGRVIGISNVGYQGVPCVSGSDPVGNMMLYNPKDKGLRRLTFDQDANWGPVVMSNGRVMYTRWEYTDLTHYYSRIVMHMNPDGTENKALFGSGSMFPNSTFDVQPLPGHASAFVGIISGHHGIARSGRVLIFDPKKATKGAAGVVQEMPYRNREVVEVVKDQLVDGVWPQFIKPMPLDDKYFLISAKLSPNSLWGLYLVDIYDNLTCLMETEGEGFISPIPVRKTATPPPMPDRVNLEDKEATVFIQDIYEGQGLRGVPRGTVKSLRIHAYEYAYLSSPSDHVAQGIQSGWDIKRNLGTVDVEEDGSVIFKVPANTPISIQPLDEEGRAVQWMRSWFTAMPGELVSCVGCHEDQNTMAINKNVMAFKKTPVRLKEPEGGVRSFTFAMEVQPVLDRACVACHNEKSGINLTGGRIDKSTGFDEAYLALHPFVHRQGPEADMPVLQPYEYHANTSELIRLLKRGHHGVELTDNEWKQLYNWIDYNAPDKGKFVDYPYNATVAKQINQYDRRIELANKYNNGAGVDWRKEITEYADFLKAKGEIQATKPNEPKAVKEVASKAKGWPFSASTAKEMQTKAGETKKQIELAPGVMVNLVRIPAGEFVMGSYQGNRDNMPTSKVKINKAFWMAEVEITNDQYKALVPEHDSRYVDQQWKDHVGPGYQANKPLQPVIRVSYEDAMAFCEKAKAKTGMNITLPTEAQWEWACRAGSEEAFWFGGLNSDFGQQENLADAQLTKMAVSGVDPQPMSKNSFWYKYYSFIPKQESVDDGSMIQTDSKSYQSNPFGLYSMHGNIGEWTRSDYQPYPYNEKVKNPSDFRVVRGGSYIERPKFSTSYARKAYYKWQRVFNVGFRIIIEE